MQRRHLQVRLVKDSSDPIETEPEKKEFPFEDVRDVVTDLFIGVAGLMVLNFIGKIAVSRLG